MGKQRSEIIWQILAGVAVFCLMVMTAILVRRELRGSGQPVATQAAAMPGRQPPVAVRNWERVAAAGHRIGPSDAPVTLVVFSDFECPFCARFAMQTLPALRQRFPREVSLLFRHWPLRVHRNAYAAAKAAECAAAQGRFEAFHDLLFAQRDSLGTKSFRAFAKEAGLPDVAAFARCHADPGPFPAIEADIAEVRRIGGTGTPTIVINGMMMRVPYSLGDIAAQIQKALEDVTRRGAIGGTVP